VVDQVKRRREFFAMLSGALAGLCLAGMMLLTVADIALRAAFGTPIRGVYELIELLLTGTFFFALPAVFLREEHIVVDLVDTVAPARVALLKRIANAVGVAILALMAWRGALAAGDTWMFGDITAELGLPRTLHWAALLTGIFGACLAALVALLQKHPWK
jgi:TRAP-type transport system small permease protein